MPTHPNVVTRLKRTPDPRSPSCSSPKSILLEGGAAKGCAVNKCIEGRKLEQKSVPLPQTRKEESAKNIEIEFLRAASLCSVMMIIIL